MKPRLTLLALILTSILLPTAAQATLITFDFESTPATNSTGAIPSLVVSSGGMTMTITRENNDVFDVFQPVAFPAAFGNRVLSPFRGSGAFDTAFLANLSAPTFFFALDFGDINPDFDSMTIQAYSQLNQGGSLLASATLPYPGVAPFSFPTFGTISMVIPGPALSLRFIGGSSVPPAEGGGLGSVYVDNIRLDTQEVVPEPASILLLATGLAGGVFRRRRAARGMAVGRR